MEIESRDREKERIRGVEGSGVEIGKKRGVEGRGGVEERRGEEDRK